METATVSLLDVNSANGSDLDVLLVGPQNQKVLLMSNACGGAMSHLGLSFSPTATETLPASACTSGTYLPTTGGGCDGSGLPSPAPAPPYGNSMSAFAGANPNGAWSLYVVNACGGSGDTLAGGWALTLVGPQSTPNPVAKTKKCKKKKKKSDAAASKKKKCKKKKKKSES